MVQKSCVHQLVGTGSLTSHYLRRVFHFQVVQDGNGISEPSTVGLWEVPNFQATKRTKVRWLKISFLSRDFANYILPPNKNEDGSFKWPPLGKKDTHHRNHQLLGSALIFGGVFTEFLMNSRRQKTKQRLKTTSFESSWAELLVHPFIISGSWEMMTGRISRTSWCGYNIYIYLYI